MRSFFLHFVILSLLVLARASAQDHVQVQNTVTGSNQAHGTFAHSQTFTMTQAGRLTRIKLRAKGGAGQTLVFHLCSTTPDASEAAGRPVTSAPIYSGSVVLPGSSNFEDLSLDLGPSNYQAAAGEFLAIQLLPASGSTLEGGAGNPYTGGGVWVDNGGTPAFNPARDLVFSVHVAGAEITATNSYEEDFEGGSAGWTVDNGTWELGLPAQSAINGANSGTNCWMTDLDADYPSLTTTAVTSSWFDCAALTEDPSITVSVAFKFSVWNDGVRLEIDLDDGQGWKTVGDDDWYNAERDLTVTSGMDGHYWGGSVTKPWTTLRHSLVGVAGRSRFRLRFLLISDVAYAHAGFAFDDVKVEVPRIVVDAAHPYFEDFEQLGAGYSTGFMSTGGGSTLNPDVWEFGTPEKPILGDPHSGSRCWATRLSGVYPIKTIAWLTSPACDFQTLSEDPVLEFAMAHEFDTWVGPDGLRVEVDLDDGNGFQTVGSLADWYSHNLNNNDGAGGVGWSGISNGWRLLRHELPGAAGRGHVRFRFLFSSNYAGAAAGALIDDIRVFVPTFKGTESLSRDDIRMQVYIDGERELGQSDSHAVQPGEAIDVFSISPEGDLVGGEYYLVAEVFSTGSSYTNVAPDVWISLGPSSVLLQGGVQPPFYVPMQMSPFGANLSYYYGGGAAGFSCRMQAIIFLPVAANGLYASSDAFELKFQ